MKSEFYVLPKSPLIGKTLGEIEREYDVRVEHIHNPELSRSSRTRPDKDRVISERLIIKVNGPWKNIARILEDST